MQSSQARDWTRVPCIGRWILNYWITREVLAVEFRWLSLMRQTGSVVITVPNNRLDLSLSSWVVFDISVVVQSLSRVPLFATPWTAACRAPVSATVSPRLLKLIYIESTMLPNHLILFGILQCPKSLRASSGHCPLLSGPAGGHSIHPSLLGGVRRGHPSFADSGRNIDASILGFGIVRRIQAILHYALRRCYWDAPH